MILPGVEVPRPVIPPKAPRKKGKTTPTQRKKKVKALPPTDQLLPIGDKAQQPIEEEEEEEEEEEKTLFCT